MASNIIYFINRHRVIIITILVLLVIFNLYSFLTKDACTEINKVSTSLEVRADSRQVVGINADTDGLKFGKISASSGVRRSIMVNATYHAEVEVSIDAPFASWVTITPARFTIRKNQLNEVSFDVFVPEGASGGNYSGTVNFCFRKI